MEKVERYEDIALFGWIFDRFRKKKEALNIEGSKYIVALGGKIEKIDGEVPKLLYQKHSLYVYEAPAFKKQVNIEGYWKEVKAVYDEREVQRIYDFIITQLIIRDLIVISTVLALSYYILSTQRTVITSLKEGLSKFSLVKL